MHASTPPRPAELVFRAIVWSLLTVSLIPPIVAATVCLRLW